MGDSTPTGEAASGSAAGGSPLSRRAFLAGIGAAGTGAVVSVWGRRGGLGGALDASSLRPAAAHVPLGGPRPRTPRRGGHFRYAITGNGTSETYNPALANTPIDGLHLNLVYDSFFRAAPYYRTSPGLVLEWLPNKDATVWELVLRKGVHWHDGKPFTAEDVIYTMRQMGDPAHLGHFAVVNVDLHGLKALSPTRVRVPLKLPVADLGAYFIYPNSATIVKDGTKHYSHPIGTGPFILESFTPGQRSVLKRNPHYWEHGKPYLDSFEVLSVDDPTARLNSLESGQADIASGLDYAQARLGSTSSYDLLVGYGGINALFTMRVDKAPFNDNRVREAMKLLMDREQLIKTVYDGLATPLNNIPGRGLPFYDHDLPEMHQDVEKAKHLLKKAGHSDLTVTLQTANIGFELPAAATVYAEQLARGGVKANVKVDQAPSYFNPTLLYLKMPFAQDLWPATSLNQLYAMTLAAGAPANETHWNDRSWDQLYLRAQAETNHHKAQELWNQVQSVLYHQGGQLYFAAIHGLDAVAKNVAGVGGPGTGWLGGTSNLDTWNWGFAKH